MINAPKGSLPPPPPPPGLFSLAVQSTTEIAVNVMKPKTKLKTLNWTKVTQVGG